MNLGPFQIQTPRLPVMAVLALTGIYLLTGIIGHDPWKTEDAIHIGIAHGFAVDGNWLMPAIAGEPWPHTAPLYHWTAALLGLLLNGWLPFHEAARFATTLYGILFLGCIAGAARCFHDVGASRIAPLLAIGTLGFMLPMHEAQPAIAGIAFAALAWWGGGLCLHGKPAGPLLLGLGLGLALLSHGLVGLLIAIAPLLAPILRRDWKGFAFALLLALLLGGLWPWLLLKSSPGFWLEWWQNELAEATRGRGLPQWRHVEQIIWAAWPILPLAIWGFWLRRRSIEMLGLPLLGCTLAFAWFFSGPPRSLATVVLLPALTLVAAGGADRLRRGAANAFDWFGLMTFTSVAGLIWLGASALQNGWPPKIARNFARLSPGFVADYGTVTLALAVGATLVWVLLMWGLRRAGWRASLRWAIGVTLTWVLTSLLWLPWINSAMTYRPVALSLKQALPRNIDCIERFDIGQAQRASLDYFAGIRTEAPGRSPRCGWRLSIDEKRRAPPAGWVEVWQGGRTSDRKERWYLDRRAAVPVTPSES